MELGWHPYLRVNATSGEFKAVDAAEYCPLKTLLGKPEEQYAKTGTLFRDSKAQLNCTLLACSSEGCAEPWIIATDLPPERGKATWYGLRNWIERGFKHDKTRGMRWNNTRMKDPDRASVLWLAMAIARHLSILGGTKFHAAPAAPVQESGCSDAPATPAVRNPLLTGKKPRPVLSVLVTGLLALRFAIPCGRLPIASDLVPATWPDRPPPQPPQYYASSIAMKNLHGQGDTPPAPISINRLSAEPADKPAHTRYLENRVLSEISRVRACQSGSHQRIQRRA